MAPATSKRRQQAKPPAGWLQRLGERDLAASTAVFQRLGHTHGRGRRCDTAANTAPTMLWSITGDVCVRFCSPRWCLTHSLTHSWVLSTTDSEDSRLWSAWARVTSGSASLSPC